MREREGERERDAQTYTACFSVSCGSLPMSLSNVFSPRLPPPPHP